MSPELYLILACPTFILLILCYELYKVAILLSVSGSNLQTYSADRDQEDLISKSA
jgi:hypothetical protein